MTSNRLPILAQEIREAHAAVLASARTTIERAVHVGKLLIEAKATVKHGEWLPWLKETGLTPRTAQRYMRLAELPADKYATVSHFGVKGALEAVAKKQHPSALEEAEFAVERLEVLVARLGCLTGTDTLPVLVSIIDEANRLLSAATEQRFRSEYQLGRLLQAEAAGHLDVDDVDVDSAITEMAWYESIKCRTAGVLARL